MEGLRIVRRTVAEYWKNHALPHWNIIHYDAATHGLDFLLYLWRHVESSGETLRVFHADGPMAFARLCSQAPLFVALQPGQLWQHGEGIIGVAWLDAVKPGVRAFINFWVHPLYRHPWVVDPIVDRVFADVFETQAFQVLFGLTPLSNPVACRAARRWGFKVLAVLPGADLDLLHGESGLTPVAAQLAVLTREDWARGRFHRNHLESRGA